MINTILDYFFYGRRLLNDKDFLEGKRKSFIERNKIISRTEIINYLLSLLKRETSYLEIGVRNPIDNFNHINANIKYGVDPGFEFQVNPVEFKMTSDTFFSKLDRHELSYIESKFDVIFIDGLHLAEQVNRDIKNAFNHIKEDGFIVLHDCNPPTQWHSRENYQFIFTPAEGNWNGTTWKAFLKWRFNNNIKSCCVDTDWGVGILSKKQPLGHSTNKENSFFEFDVFDKNRVEFLNLVTFNELKKLLSDE